MDETIIFDPLGELLNVAKQIEEQKAIIDRENPQIAESFMGR